MKRIISATLVLLMVVLSITSCGLVEAFVDGFKEGTCDHVFPSNSPYQCTECGAFNEAKCAPLYTRLQNAAGDWSDVNGFISESNYCIQELPSDYKEVAQYKALLEFWKETREKYTQEAVRLLLRDVYYTDYVDFKKLRDVYLSLSEKQNTLTWDFKAYGDKLLDEDKEGSLLSAFAIGKWIDSYGHYFNFYEDDNNIIFFSTNLPFDDSNKVASYSVKSRNIFLKVDFFDIPAYRVLDITRNSITVYCFDNEKSYVLEKIDEGYKENSFFILNTATKKWHLPSCIYLPDIENEKRVGIADYYKGLYPGYTACQHCKPQ